MVSRLRLKAKFCLQPPRLLPRVPGSTFDSSAPPPTPSHPSCSEIDESISRSERRPSVRAGEGQPGIPQKSGSREPNPTLGFCPVIV